MRRYDDPVEVRTDSLDEPLEFLWRGRLWQVRAIAARWDDDRPWWTTPGVRTLLAADGSSQEAFDALSEAGAEGGGVTTLARLDTLLAGREMWRVEAFVPRRPARPALRDDEAGHGSFDLALSRSTGRWRLVASSTSPLDGQGTGQDARS